MKKEFYLLLVFWQFHFVSLAQTSIAFTYDGGGNMIQRQVQVMPPGPGAKFINPFSNSEKKDSLNVVEFKVYPNPTRDNINLEGKLPEGSTSASLFLFSSTGQTFLKDDYYGELKTLNISGLKPGLYYFEVKYSKNRSSNYKIVITN